VRVCTSCTLCTSLSGNEFAAIGTAVFARNWAPQSVAGAASKVGRRTEG